MKKIVPLAFLYLLSAVPVSAETPRHYVVAKLGGFQPNSYWGYEARDTDNFYTGYMGELAIGHYFSWFLGAELSAGYSKSSGDAHGVSGNLTSYPIMFNMKVTAPFKGKDMYFPDVGVYMLAGMGAYVTDLKASTSGVTASDSDTTIGYRLRLGIDFRLSENIFMGIEGGQFWAKPSFNIPWISSVNVRIDEFTGNIGYRF